VHDPQWYVVFVMKLVGKDGQSLELRILGYQFPHLATAPYDSNWLIVAGDVKHARGSWQFTDPCLLTYEAAELASWINSLADAGRLSGICDFIEPSLEFRALIEMDRSVLRVTFDYQALPSWASDQTGAEEPMWIDFPIEELDLRLAALQWRAELAAYPQRTPR
jgi:hypothetical protein